MNHRWVKAPKNWTCTFVPGAVDPCWKPAVVGCKTVYCNGEKCMEGRCVKHAPKGKPVPVKKPRRR